MDINKDTASYYDSPHISNISINNSEWWDNFSQVIRNSFSPNRVDLEIPTGNMDNLQEWSFTSAAEILSNSDEAWLFYTAVDFHCREKLVAFVCGNEIGITTFMTHMEELATSGTSTGEAVSKALREIVNPRNGKFRMMAIRQAIAADYLTITVKVLKDLIYVRSRSSMQAQYECIDLTIINMLWFLSAVASNHSGFASKIRQMLKVKFFHHDLYRKMFFGKSSAHYPLLKLLLRLSRNASIAQTLGKDGIMQTIRKSFAILSNIPGGKLLILVDAISQLVKDKTNCIRFLKAGLLVKMMRCFGNWELWRGKGLLRLSKSVIAVYTRIGLTRSGRKALCNCDAILQIRKFCESCPSERAFDDVMMRASAMISVCCGKDKLPIDNDESPIVFKLPQVNGLNKNNDSGGSSSDDEGSESDDGSEVASEDVRTVEDDDDDDTSDDERSISDEEMDAKLELKSDGSKSGDLQRLKRQMAEISVTKSDGQIPIERLLMYREFFQEFENYGYQTDFHRMLEPKSSPLASTLDPMFDENANETNRKNKNIPHSEHKYSWLFPECKYWNSIEELRRQYLDVANVINHVAPFIKIAYPEFALGYSTKTSENMLSSSDRSVLRGKIISYIAKIAGSDTFKPKVVYSLDDLLNKKESENSTKLRNTDEKDVGRYDKKMGLQFESRFESGNLRKAIQVGDREYDLLLTSDVNSRHHNQWFYFQVSNTSEEKSYTFNIINCTKTNSLFNYGMQPVVFSVTEALKGRSGWIRSGSNICYYKNGYKCISKKRNSSRVYHTLSFSLSFCHKGDIVYLAYHIPYTYSRLMVELNAMVKAADNHKNLFVRYDSLCHSLNKNEVPALTITSTISTTHPINRRKIIFLTGRVHPGESNCSWVMKGILEYLLFGKNNTELLNKFIFKIVPMLNVEGVINGCHRCGLTSQDLNRCWKSPSEILHPTIYHAKMLIEYCCRILKSPPLVYCDLHGHSRRKNLFLYGCSTAKSWSLKDKSETEDSQLILALPESMERVSSAFCLTNCNYDVRKSRETTARVAVWRDYAIARSYTLECSYCGCDRGPYKGIAFGTNHLLEIGKDLCQAFLDF